jgi:hypothetical protein
MKENLGTGVDWKGLETKFKELINLLNLPLLSQRSFDKKKNKNSGDGGIQLISPAQITLGRTAQSAEEIRKKHRENVELGLVK